MRHHPGEHPAHNPSESTPPHPATGAELITRRRILYGTLAAAGVGVVTGLILGKWPETHPSDGLGRGPHTTEGFGSQKAAPASQSARSSRTPSAAPNTTHTASADTKTTPPPDRAPSSEITPGTKVSLFLGMVFMQKQDQTDYTAIYNPILIKGVVHKAAYTAEGLEIQPAAGTDKDWFPADTTDALLKTVRPTQPETRGFDGAIQTDDGQRLPTYVQELAGQTIDGVPDAAGLKRLGVIGYQYGNTTSPTDIKLNMTTTGTQRYPAD